ncbi:MAG: hypothetical protein JWN25_213 [Verrucomicrobiales bacterium]|nr:hypothetical protein [Verrucomicrobiales bacterium]
MSRTLENQSQQNAPGDHRLCSPQNRHKVFKSKSLKVPLHGGSLPGGVQSLSGYQKMSPSVTGDNRVLLGKCHFHVTFLSISKCDIRSASKHPLPNEGKSNLDPKSQNELWSQNPGSPDEVRSFAVPAASEKVRTFLSCYPWRGW